MASPPRLAASVLVSALIRRVEAEGGSAAVLRKGDPDAGSLILLISHRGEPEALVERVLGEDGYGWRSTGPGDAMAWSDYLGERRSRDPDVWVVELDHRDALEIARSIV